MPQRESRTEPPLRVIAGGRTTTVERTAIAPTQDEEHYRQVLEFESAARAYGRAELIALGRGILVGTVVSIVLWLAIAVAVRQALAAF